MIDSPRNIFMSGFVTLAIFSISFISVSEFCIRPAVSIRTTSILFFFAYFIASNPTAAGSAP